MIGVGITEGAALALAPSLALMAMLLVAVVVTLAVVPLKTALSVLFVLSAVDPNVLLGRSSFDLAGVPIDLYSFVRLLLVLILIIRVQPKRVLAVIASVWPFALLWLYLGVTILWSADRGTGLRLWVELAYVALVYSLARVAFADHREDAVAAIKLGGWAALFTTVTIALTMPSIGYVSYDEGVIGGFGVKRLAGALGPSSLSFQLLVVAMVCYVDLLHRRLRYSDVVLLLLSTIVILLTQTRITLVALAVGAIIANGTMRRSRWNVVVLFLLIGLVFLPARWNRVITAPISEVTATLLRAPQSYDSVLNVGTLLGRLKLWDVALSDFARHAWFGTGFGATARLFDTTNVTSDLVGLLAEAGIVGLVLALAATLFLLKFTVDRRDRYARALAFIAVGTFVLIMSTDNAFKNYFQLGQGVAVLLGAFSSSNTGTSPPPVLSHGTMRTARTG